MVMSNRKKNFLVRNWNRKFGKNTYNSAKPGVWSNVKKEIGISRTIFR